MQKKNYEMDMCHGPILGKMLLFAVPLICSSVLQLLFNAADIVVVGRFAGDHSMAAVGSTTALINLLTNFFVGLSIGANVLIAKLYGANKKKDVGNAVHTAIVLSIYSGIILTLVGVIGTRQILALMDTPKEVFDKTVCYLRIYFLGMTATMIYDFGSSVLRAIGDTKRPLYYLLFSGAVNVVLNLIFVIIFRMDVAGVGIATMISQCLSAALILRCLLKEQGVVRLVLNNLYMDKMMVFRIVQIGIPAGFQGVIFAFSNVVIQSAVNSFGPVTVAGNSSAANIEGFVYFAMNAFYQATLSFVGQNMGSKNYKRIDKILLIGEACVIVTGIVTGHLALYFGKELLSIYSGTPSVIHAGMYRLNVIARTYALCGMMDVMVGALRGMGYSIMPMFVSLVGACGLRLLWIFTAFRLPRFHNITMLYASYPVTWIITVLAHIICFIIVRKKINRREVE